MEPVEVSARFDADGAVTPLRFKWRGEEYPVVSTGRRWQGKEGHHVLVLVPNEMVFELIFQAAETRWYLKQPGKNRSNPVG